jgi:hypothetical protein
MAGSSLMVAAVSVSLFFMTRWLYRWYGDAVSAPERVLLSAARWVSAAVAVAAGVALVVALVETA